MCSICRFRETISLWRFLFPHHSGFRQKKQEKTKKHIFRQLDVNQDSAKCKIHALGARNVCAPALERELRTHLEEQTEAYQAEGMTEDAAEAEAVRQMGDEEAVGLALDAVHRPKKRTAKLRNPLGRMLCMPASVHLTMRMTLGLLYQAAIFPLFMPLPFISGNLYTVMDAALLGLALSTLRQSACPESVPRRKQPDPAV